MTRHLATLRESYLLPPFTHAWLNFFTLTFRALGRNHIASTPIAGHRNALFQLNSRIPLVRSISKSAVRRLPMLAAARVHDDPAATIHRKGSPQSSFFPDTRAFPGGSTRARASASSLCPRRLPAAARQAQPLEPILLPKLRIHFADFPYLHCSIDQRLFTLETCCCYGYDRTREARKTALPRIFKGRRECTGRHLNCAAMPDTRPYLRTIRFQGAGPSRRKDNSSRDSRQRLRVRLRCRDRPRPPPRSGSGMLTRFPFAAQRPRQTPQGRRRTGRSLPRPRGSPLA